MAIFYVDFEGGNDANDGLSFANRWKTIATGASAARIAPGDTIRIMASPDPTSLGINGTWTSEPQQLAVAPASSTNATPIVITRNNHGLVTGDTVVITGHTVNTNANGTWTVTNLTSNTFSLDGSVGNGVGGATGTIRKITNSIVTLASELNQTLACTGYRTVWVASSNVTATLLTTDFKEHNQSDSIAIAAGFTTGLAAYKAIGSTLDLSGYQQVSFWIKQTAGTLATNGQITLRLCSDTAGVTTVDTINVPAISILNVWNCFTVDLATNLGSAIQSIALYVATDLGAQTFLINNIIACKASSADDSLCLQSLIGKNDGYWFPIMSIVGTRVMLGQPFPILPNSAVLGGYYGVSETVTTYKREPISLGQSAAATASSNLVNDNGTSGNPIIYSGGWNRTDMSTQVSKTYYSVNNGTGNGLSATNRAFITFEKMGLINFLIGCSFTGSGSDDLTLNDMEFIGCGTGISTIVNTQDRPIFSDINIISCGTAFTTLSCYGSYSNIVIMHGGVTTGSVIFAGNYSIINGMDILHVGSMGFVLGSAASSAVKNVINDLVIRSAGSNSLSLTNAYDTIFNDPIFVGGTASGNISITMVETSKETIFNNLTSSGHATTVSLAGTAGEIILVEPTTTDTALSSHGTVNSGIKLYVHKPLSNEYNMYSDGITCSYDSIGEQWDVSVVGRTTLNPAIVDIGEIVVGTGQVTISLDVSATTGNVISLVCYGSLILGVSNDVRDTHTGGADPSFVPIEIQFTPTVAGKVKLFAEVYNTSGTGTASFKNLGVTQA